MLLGRAAYTGTMCLNIPHFPLALHACLSWDLWAVLQQGCMVSFWVQR